MGVVLNFVAGELGRKQLVRKFKPDRVYKALFHLSIGIMIFAAILGAMMNSQLVTATASKIPYIAAGIALVILVSFVMLKIRSSKPLPTDATKERTIIRQTN